MMILQANAFGVIVTHGEVYDSVLGLEFLGVGGERVREWKLHKNQRTWFEKGGTHPGGPSRICHFIC